MTLFEKGPLARWKPDGEPHLEVAFPILSISESGGHRLVERERPHRPGAKIDKTGRKAKRWTVEILLENSMKEPGLVERVLYPDVLKKLIASFDAEETGTLTLPTKGVLRACAGDYGAKESHDERDAARMTFTWVEDNEDKIGASVIGPPTPASAARLLAEQTQFSAQSDGAWDTSLADLNQFASELEALANFPGDTVADLDSQAGIMVAATNRAGRAFSDPSRRGRDVLTDPDSSVTQRKLHETRDLAGRARAARERYTSVVFETPRTLFEIAADVGQSVEDLLPLNGALDPLLVPAGTPVRILV